MTSRQTSPWRIRAGSRVEHERETRIQPDQAENERGEADHECAVNPGMRKKTETAFEFVEQAHA